MRFGFATKPGVFLFQVSSAKTSKFLMVFGHGVQDHMVSIFFFVLFSHLILPLLCALRASNPEIHI